MIINLMFSVLVALAPTPDDNKLLRKAIASQPEAMTNFRGTIVTMVRLNDGTCVTQTLSDNFGIIMHYDPERKRVLRVFMCAPREQKKWWNNR